MSNSAWHFSFTQVEVLFIIKYSLFVPFNTFSPEFNFAITNKTPVFFVPTFVLYFYIF